LKRNENVVLRILPYLKPPSNSNTHIFRINRLRHQKDCLQDKYNFPQFVSRKKKFFSDRKEMSSTKVQIAELAEKVEKLEKRLKKDEKLGVIVGKKDIVKREPSEYNRFIAEHVNEMKGSTSQQRFAEAVKLWKEKKDGKKRKNHKKRRNVRKNEKRNE